MSSQSETSSNAAAMVRSSGPHRRSSKACEPCRTRRIKCSGTVPCEPCRSAGLDRSCTLRVKARPNRPPSSKIELLRNRSTDLQTIDAPQTHDQDHHTSEPSETGDNPHGSHVSEPLHAPSLSQLSETAIQEVESNNPLDQIEAALALWCVEKGVPISQLVFKVDTRLATIAGSPLPQPSYIRQYEDSLMERFVTSPEFDHLNNVDRPWLLGLYGRYRAVPHSLTSDQKALVYASLCLSRYNEIRLSWNETMSGGTPVSSMEQPREDVTYYRMSCNALDDRQQPSTCAMWALFCLVPYTFGMGGPEETKTLVKLMAWHAKELGLHDRAIASLYPPQELVGPLFSALQYSDLLRASLTDLCPSLPLGDIDVDFTPPLSMVPDCLQKSSYFTAKFLKDFTDPSINTTTEEYVTISETSWRPYLRELRHSTVDAPRSKIAWAEFRYSWLRILLYIPLLVSPRLGSLAHATIARAVTQILYTYAELIAVNQLNASWPQIQRLVVCGQLLILCHDSGEFHRREAQNLLQMVVDLLQKHQDTWAICSELEVGFRMAAQAFDIDLGVNASPPVLQGERMMVNSSTNVAPLNPPPGNDLGLAFDFPFDFDISQLFSITHNEMF